MNYNAEIINKRNPIGRAILNAGRKEGKRAKSIRLIGKDAAQIDRCIRRAAAAIIQYDLIASEISACGARDFHRLVNVSTCIVIMNFVDEYGHDLPLEK